MSRKMIWFLFELKQRLVSRKLALESTSYFSVLVSVVESFAIDKMYALFVETHFLTFHCGDSVSYPRLLLLIFSLSKFYTKVDDFGCQSNNILEIF